METNPPFSERPKERAARLPAKLRASPVAGSPLPMLTPAPTPTPMKRTTRRTVRWGNYEKLISVAELLNA
jgi:hypothetical protein